MKKLEETPPGTLVRVARDDPRASFIALAWLADPSEQDADLRDLTWRRLFNSHLREVIAKDHAAAHSPMWLRPSELMLDYRQVAGGRKHLETRLRWRSDAGAVALPFILEAQGHSLPPFLKPGFSPLDAARAVLGSEAAAKARHLIERQFKPSEPVLHLCAAWAALIMQRNNAQQALPNPASLSAADLDAWLSEAERFEDLLSRSRLNVDRAKLVRVRLA